MMIMLKKMLIAALFMSCAAFSFSQTKPRLGILPFTGGASGDGETIAFLFSLQPEIQNAFTLIPRTSAASALIAEQRFQHSGYTDSDTIASIGRMLNADYVVSGHIRQLGNRNLLIITIVNVETFEQIAGDYRTYRRIEEVRNLLPSMSQKMVAASKRDTSRLPRLAIAPFNIANTGVNVHDAETLAQILAVEIANTGKYAVLPRTSTMQAALQELRYQLSGYTADEEAKALGRAINAEYVLSSEARRIGSINMFTAQILHVEESRLLIGGAREYLVVDDGINLMNDLAMLLTDPTGAQARIAVLERQRSRLELFENPTRFWSVGASVGTSFAEPWLVGALYATLAPLRYSFVRVGCDAGFISGVEGVGYSLIYPFAHYAFFLPFDLLPLPFTEGGWHAGIGGGYMMAEYLFDGFTIQRRILAADFITGFNIRNKFDISYTFRTNFSSSTHKLSAGVTYRFQSGSK